MKSVFGGKTYNTETAIKLCDVPCEYDVAHKGYHVTGLYMTKKGAFFIAGKGESESMWTRKDGENRVGSEGLWPVTPEYACEILELQDEFEWLERLFGADAEAAAEETVLLIRMSFDDRAHIERRAKEEGVSRNQYCLNVLANWTGPRFDRTPGII